MLFFKHTFTRSAEKPQHVGYKHTLELAGVWYQGIAGTFAHQGSQASVMSRDDTTIKYVIALKAWVNPQP